MPRKMKTMDGNNAAAYASYPFTDVEFLHLSRSRFGFDLLANQIKRRKRLHLTNSITFPDCCKERKPGILPIVYSFTNKEKVFLAKCPFAKNPTP